MRKFRPATIRGRLVAVLAVSLSAVLVLMGVLVSGELDEYRDAERTTADVDLALSVQMMVHELQRERGLTNGLLAGRAADREPLAIQRRLTDEALTRFAEATGRIDSPQLRAARERLARLGETRTEVDGGSARREQAFAYFTDGIGELVEAGAAPGRTRDGELLRGVAALTELGHAKEATAQARGFLNGVLSAGRFKNTEFQTFSEIRAMQQVALTEFRRNATAVQQQRADAALHSQIAMQAQHVEEYAVAAADGRSLTGLDAGTWWSSMTAVIDGVWIVQLSIGEEVRDRAAELRDGASADLLTYLLIAALLVIGEVALTLVAVRSITRPLTLLASEAEAMASRRLPEVVTRLRAGDHGLGPPQPVAVPEGSGREILAVARAFGRVQETAVQLASEQAVLRRNTTDSLVNLARRNQNLVRRQLGFISRLEHQEADPTALANLFELDHLATRMRRNAESLLVLVGEAGPRAGTAPLHVADVVRAALSEVEDYRRVVLRRMDEIAVSGLVVTELAHLLAELVENALAFSPPDVEVEIYGRLIGNEYLIAVIDHGVGMAPEAMETANARLSGREDFLDAPTRHLGHYVVGRLAQRLGADVQIGESPVAGVTARVHLPAAVLADPVRGDAAARVAAAPPRRPVTAPPAAPALGAGQMPNTGATTGGTTTAVLPPPSPPAFGAAPLPGYATTAPTAYTAHTAHTAHTAPAAHTAHTAHTAPAAPPPLPPTGPVVERTRNGLAKRVPRSRTAPAPVPRPAAPAAPAAHGTGPAEVVGERSPEDVRSMLSSFRGGHLRGEISEFVGDRAPAQGAPGYHGAPAYEPAPPDDAAPPYRPGTPYHPGSTYDQQQFPTLEEGPE